MIFHLCKSYPSGKNARYFCQIETKDIVHQVSNAVHLRSLSAWELALTWLEECCSWLSCLYNGIGFPCCWEWWEWWPHAQKSSDALEHWRNIWPSPMIYMQPSTGRKEIREVGTGRLELKPWLPHFLELGPSTSLPSHPWILENNSFSINFFRDVSERIHGKCLSQSRHCADTDGFSLLQACS